MAVAKAEAVTTPTPGMDMSNWHGSLCRASRINWRVSSAARTRTLRQASSSGMMIGCEVVVIGQLLDDVRFEVASFATGDDEAERLHETADLIGDIGFDPDQLRPRCDQGASEHAVEPFDPHFAIEAHLREVRQSIGIVCIGLVRRHIQRSFRVPSIDADRRQTFSLEGMEEPHRQRSGLEDDPLWIRDMLANRSRNDLGI